MICDPCKCDARWQRYILNNGSPDPLHECEQDDRQGHASCKGCDCQHKPVKAGQIVSE